MKPYRIVEESETHITYEYRTTYTWTLYAMLLVMVIGMVLPNDMLTIIGGAGIGAYFIAKLFLGNEPTLGSERRCNQMQFSLAAARHRSEVR